MPGSGVIVSYHRVADDEYDPFGLCIPKAAFARHVELYRRDFQVLPLTELAARAAEGSLPPRALAITLDDGYPDQLEATRQLAAARLPATLFVTALGLARPTEPWWERLARAHRPPELFELHAQLWKLPAEAREDRLARLAPCEAVRDSHRFLTAGELRAVEVEVGAHGVEHLHLPAQEAAARKQEIEAGRRALEEVLGRPIDTFAYPFGAHDQATVTEVRAAGFVAAVTTVEAAVGAGSDALALPRLPAPAEVAALEALLTRALDRAV